MNTILLSICLILLACGSNPYRAEGINEKMSRFKAADTQVNPPPSIELSDNQFKSSKRAPASIAPVEIENNKKPWPNKQLYFLTLLQQYREFNSFAGNNAEEINSCPNFHSLMVKFNQYHKQMRPKKVQSLFRRYYSENINYSKYPELAMAMDNDGPRLGDLLEKSPHKVEEYFKSALTGHLQRTRKELEELCEFGRSENFYIFVNLITYSVGDKGLPPSKKSASNLLKTSLFSNEAILTSLRNGMVSGGRMPASVPSFGGENFEMVKKRLKVEWINSYYQTLGK